MGFEIDLDVDYWTEPRRDHLCDLMGSQEASVYPIRLWCVAAKHYKNGFIPSEVLLEKACGWHGETGKLHRALLESGFIEAVEGGWHIHQWEKYTGRIVLAYEAKKLSQKEGYALKYNLPMPEDRAVDCPSDTVGHLLKQARSAKLPDHPKTIRAHVEAWIARSNAQAVEQILMDPWSRGKSCREIQQHFFNTNGSKSIQDISEEWVRESMEQEKAKSQ